MPVRKEYIGSSKGRFDPYTVGQLKEFIKDLPDETLIVHDMCSALVDIDPPEIMKVVQVWSNQIYLNYRPEWEPYDEGQKVINVLYFRGN